MIYSIVITSKIAYNRIKDSNILQSGEFLPLSGNLKKR